MFAQRLNRHEFCRVIARCLLTSVLGLCLLLPEASKAEERLTSQALMRLIGLDNVFDGIAQQFSAMKSPALKAMAEADPKFHDAWVGAARKAFVVKDMRKKLESYLSGVLKPAEQRQIIRLYSHGIGKKATDIERQAQTPDARQKMMKDAARILAEVGKQPKRQKVYLQIQKLLNTVENSTNTALNMAFTTALGMVTAGKSDTKPTTKELQTIIERQRPTIKAAIEKYSMLSMAFTYKSMTLKELATYKALLQRKVVRKLYVIISSSTSAVMLDAGMTFGRELAKNLNVEPI
jgi:hypothetical protein